MVPGTPEIHSAIQLKRINLLIKAIDRNPYDGIGKPEPLKANLQGYWSRRMDGEHRIVYAVEEKPITYISFRFHCEK
jgi:toxin YoeB